MPEGGGVMKKSEWGTRTQAVKNVCCEEKKGTEVSSWIKRGIMRFVFPFLGQRAMDPV